MTDRKIKLFREWLDDKRRICSNTQCYDAVHVLNGIISMYDSIFELHDAEFDDNTNETDANKIEPKFKVRDWIVNGSANPCYVKSIFGDYYELCSCEGFEYTKHIKDLDNNYHLWTIRNAKDGDILLSKYNQPFIYNGIFNDESVGAYGGINISGEEFLKSCLRCNWTSKEEVKPATKEQRALLFEKIREAGYTWDGDKNELKRNCNERI